MERLGALDLPSVMLAERRLIFIGVVAMGVRIEELMQNVFERYN